MWLGKSLVGDRPSWHKEPINFFNKMLSIRKVRLLITSRYMSMQSYECVIISKMFLIYFISYGCNDSALVFLGGAEASASPSFALPMFITIKKIIILHLYLGVPAATVGGTGTPWHTRGYAPALNKPISRSYYSNWVNCCEERTDDEHEQSSLCAKRICPLLERFSFSTQDRL